MGSRPASVPGVDAVLVIGVDLDANQLQIGSVIDDGREDLGPDGAGTPLHDRRADPVGRSGHPKSR